jgi:hypothetical protein
VARDAPARGMAPEPGRPPPNLARSVGTGENVFVSWLICGPTCSECMGRSQLECLLCGTQSTSLEVGGPRRRGRVEGRGGARGGAEATPAHLSDQEDQLAAGAWARPQG